MYLRDIQLDLPYREETNILKDIMIKHNCTYEEALKIDYEENWMIGVRRRFELETRCVISMFLRLLGKYKTKNCSKIVIDCVENELTKKCPSYMGSCAGIGLVRYELDYIKFFNINSNEKKQSILQIIKESFYTIGKEEKWDLNPIEETITKVQELNYDNFWVYGKSVKSPNKSYTAELYIEHHIEKIDFFIVVRNKQNEIIKKKLIITEKPSEWFYAKYFGKLLWISDTEINLCAKNGFIIKNVSLE